MHEETNALNILLLRTSCCKSAPYKPTQPTSEAEGSTSNVNAKRVIRTTFLHKQNRRTNHLLNSPSTQPSPFAAGFRSHCASTITISIEVATTTTQSLARRNSRVVYQGGRRGLLWLVQRRPEERLEVGFVVLQMGLLKNDFDGTLYQQNS